MVLNGYSGIALFAALLRVLLGAVLLVAALRTFRRAPDTEPRYYLRFVLGATLLGVALAAWPLFYLVLQSYVGLWPDVMCIDGVTRIGIGSANAAAHLPGLIAFLEFSKPALIFLAGVWFVFHLVLRSHTDPHIALGSTVALLGFGLLGVLDGAAEGAYLLIPKQEQVLATGCCSVASEAVLAAPAAASQGGHDAPGVPPLTWMLFAFGAVTIALLSVCLRRLRAARAPGRWLALSLVGAATLLPIGTLFLREVGAPLFLRLPYHPCAYCMIAYAPESLVAVALFTMAVFSVGWAGLARLLDRSNLAVTAPLLRVARFGLLATLLMIAVRMVTA